MSPLKPELERPERHEIVKQVDAFERRQRIRETVVDVALWLITIAGGAFLLGLL